MRERGEVVMSRCLPVADATLLCMGFAVSESSHEQTNQPRQLQHRSLNDYVLFWKILP